MTIANIQSDDASKDLILDILCNYSWTVFISIASIDPLKNSALNTLFKASRSRPPEWLRVHDTRAIGYPYTHTRIMFYVSQELGLSMKMCALS